jgi:hypothetical protein
MNKNDILLTIIMCGRNDGFGGNFTQRLEHNLNKLIDNIEKMNLNNIEILVTDWGSAEDSKLYDTLKVKKLDYLKFIYVPYELTKKYSPDSKFSIPHAMNTAVRRMSGKYMLSLDADSYVPFKMFKGIYDLLVSDNREYIFYWGSRYMMPYISQIDITNIEQMDSLIDEWENNGKPISHCPSGCLHKFEDNQWIHSRVNLTHFSGGGCAILINKSLVQESNFLFEKLNKWGWMDIEFHNRMNSRYPCLGDLEILIGSEFFHIGHHEVEKGQDTHGFNPGYTTDSFQANNNDWGLGLEKLIINNEF